MKAGDIASIEQRSREARRLWKSGDAAFKKGQFVPAYRLWTEAHDLVTDCPQLHLEAHRKLRMVTRRHRNKIEYLTDTALVALAPLRIFDLIAFFKRSKVAGNALCRRPA